MTRIDDLPALLARMMITKELHDEAEDFGSTLDEALARCFDMGGDLEREMAEDWIAAQGYGESGTTKDLAIASIHRLTTEGGGVDEQ